MKKMLRTVCMTTVLLAMMSALAMAAPKIAVIEYLNTTEEDRDFIQEVVAEKYTNYFQTLGYEVVPKADVDAALTKSGYSRTYEELPEKENLAAVAEATGADFVVGMEISDIDATRHMSMFQAKVTVKTKLAYRVYAAKADRVYSFKTASRDDNKTMFGDVGYKAPIVKALSIGMDESNDKIRTFIAEQ
ncbi:hypothetical protein TAMA11512_02090 [Selenomonas sp. TAMA-11512]|uniref:hypothetical protein n=1 Tax=Selenomonas sp. TAMA-11512 TaxID=3095337 RepID=UPI0030851570|nr:hypothetical protein TAMA11512_02090 [Selenomonas sp. TAMA-11512]